MNELQKAGGIAAGIEAAAYVIGSALFIGFLDSSGYVGPAQKVAFLIENQMMIYLGLLATYVLTSIALVVLAIALHERLKDGSPALMQVATSFGLIWAGLIVAGGMISIVGVRAAVALHPTDPDGAGSLWQAVGIVHEGLGGGIEIVGGLWVLLVSWAALKSGKLPKALNYLGVLIGVAGVLTAVPGLGALVDLFGLAQIIWFVSLGWILLRKVKADAVLAPAT